MNYKEWLNEWLSTCVKPMVKSRTFEKYDEIVRLKIEPSLGDCDLACMHQKMLLFVGHFSYFLLVFVGFYINYYRP